MQNIYNKSKKVLDLYRFLFVYYAVMRNEKETKMSLEKSYDKYLAIFNIVTENMDDWKDVIERAYITDKVIEENEWTVEDVIEAVEFFTASTPTLVKENYPGDEGYRIDADGYRLGTSEGL